MAEKIICGSCNENEAIEKCAICGINLCEMCKQVVQTEDISASHRVGGVSTEGVLGPAQKKITVCARCLAETDFFEEEEHAAVAEDAESVKDRLKKFKMPGKGDITATVGSYELDLTDITPDIRGKEELVKKILKTDYNESRVRQYGTKIIPFPKAGDLSEWDQVLLNRYRPLYTSPEYVIEHGKRKQASDIVQASKTLKDHVSATAKALASARGVLDEAIAALGPEKEIDLGRSIAYPTCNIALLTGFYPKNLAEMDGVLEYGESQLVEQLAVLEQKNGNPMELEARSLHLGSIFALATEVEEMVKICCFGFLSTGDMGVADVANYPPARTPVGMGTVDRSKPVLAFFGDNIMPIFHTVGVLEEEGIEKKIEITGIGNAGHELVRMYPEGKVLTSTGKAIKAIRSGIADLIVATESCFPIDLAGQAKKAGIPLLAAGSATCLDAPDLSEETEEEICNRLNNREAVLVRSYEKAANVIAVYFKNFAGKMGTILKLEELEFEKERCTACDRCFHACPNSLQISTAMKDEEGFTFQDIYKSCFFCGKCEDVCPENIPIIDLILAANAEAISKDAFRMRPGRGPLSHLEFRDLTFGLVLGGNGPGMAVLLGCGRYPGTDDEMAFMAKELLDRNCVVMTAGCAAADVSRIIDEKSEKSFPEKYLAMATLKGFVNCGGCTADSHILGSLSKFALLGGGVSIKGNLEQPADYSMNRAPFVVIIWGAASDKMLAKASSFVRMGAQVVVGPNGLETFRSLVGNKYDRSTWTIYDGVTGDLKEIDPSPMHGIYPVETKEEALTMTMKLFALACNLRDPRLSVIDNYTEIHEKYFGHLPDDWTYFVRSPLELHVMKRMRLLKILREEYGWEIERTQVNKVKDRSGNMVSLEDYTENYGIKQGAYATLIKRLVMREAVKE
ncbi:MAG: 4Fe-4S dicluster domain-containing protein [Desulfobacterales bacterium]